MVLILNVLLKQNIVENSLLISSGATGTLGLILTVLYAISVKPKFNQIMLFILCISTTFSAIVFMAFDLPYKLILGGVSIPLFLVLCGLWIYVKYSKIEVK